jgi:hypothetical protein
MSNTRPASDLIARCVKGVVVGCVAAVTVAIAAIVLIAAVSLAMTFGSISGAGGGIGGVSILQPDPIVVSFAASVGFAGGFLWTVFRSHRRSDCQGVRS